ncbi:putative P450 monooxygenase [Aureobasidium pullulans]|uniref:Putative P450 monooxygenase n=1 Tax=Aureobasidium pullulans TaxID=5580 RepID=A0A4S9WYZ7_AURPU|nr:putative P450 monooxygenase [Aureobasidium pullulans]THW55994.1 putative P450 monooxygenase [Aureobasidium pullulans]THX08816.1 putative P450 monooxygenase [Aureobasidium pullulans]THX98516.1 putative P450 monooxygenase [Aureobasidium pullulans]THZ71091.1 putative P450 monooxygenase [Aureobasidium pullulans]
MDFLIAYFTARPALSLLALTLALLLAARLRNSKTTVPKTLPWVGKSTGPLAEIRASYASFNNVRQWLAEGYAKYSKKGKSYIFPDFSGKPTIIIPNDKLRWLIDNPDDVASVAAVHYDLLAGDYNFTSPHILKTLYHEHVVHRSLARNLDDVIPGTWDEIQHAFNDTWGTDTKEWKDICVFDNLMQTIARVSNRMFVGLPLCRNKTYLSNMGAFAQDVILCMTLLNFTPAFTKPLFGRIFSIPNMIHYKRTSKLTIPIIAQRIQDIKNKCELPNDYLTWHIKLANAEGRPEEATPEMIARYLMPLNFAAIHTTTFTIVNTFFDILGSDPSKEVLEGLREEAERVFAEANGVWTKASLSKLVRADSAIKESMRVSNFATQGVQRKIVAREGLMNSEEGWTAPYGSIIGIDVHSVHHDPDVYPEPNTYDAFRFSRPREAFEAGAGGDKDARGSLGMRNMGMITTGNTFVPFGHGRHACPGRFFVNHELKMLLAYVVMNYDVQYLSERPENQWFGVNVIPSMKTNIKVHRRTARKERQ